MNEDPEQIIEYLSRRGALFRSRVRESFTNLTKAWMPDQFTMQF